MALELNPNSPSPQVTEYLQNLGLELGVKYQSRWSDCLPSDWELVKNKETIISLDARKIQELIKANILISRF